MKFLSLFKRKSAPVFELTSSIDVSAIDESFHLLKATTAEVSQAAINAAKVLQDRLDDSETRFYWTIDSIEDFVLIKDGEGRWQTLNKFGQHLFAMHHGEYYGKTDQQLADEYPRLRETLSYCVQTDEKAWATGTSSRSEERISFGNSFRYLDMIKTPMYDESGARNELIIVGRDVTEIHEKSRREKACFQALNSASDAIVIIDKRARIFFCNDQFVNLFKFESYQAVVDQHLTDALPNFPLYDEMWETVQQNKTWSIQCPYLLMPHNCSTADCPLSLTQCAAHNCSIRKMQLTVLPMMNGQPQPIYYICTFKANCSNE
jgi:PAS domain-containing protein